EYIATRDGVELMEPTAGGGYLEYIAERPRSHGLISADGAADLEQTMEEINAHAGPVWTFIYSLKREDAARLGYENGEVWHRVLLARSEEHTSELQSRFDLVCRLLLDKKNTGQLIHHTLKLPLLLRRAGQRGGP